MDICTALRKRRTVRSFKNEPISKDKLIKMIDCARLSPSGANLQSLKYMIITEEDVRKKLFPFIAYAGYTPEWNPEFSESPTAFIAVFNDTKIRPNGDMAQCDCGIAMMSITLAAYEMGIDSCLLGAIKREEIVKVLGTDESYTLLYLVGLGVSNQENSYFDSNEDVKYIMNEEKNFLVPKRPLEEVLL